MKSKLEVDIPDALRCFDNLPACAHVAQPTVLALYGISPATLWRWVNIGKIPQPHRYGLRATRWNVGELRAALNATAA